MEDLTDGELLGLVSGDLTGSARETAERHAGQCPQCRARLKELTDTWQLLGGWQLPADGPDLTDRIARAAAMAAQSRRHARPVARLLARAAAAALVAAAIGYSLGRASRPQRPATLSRSAGRVDEDDLMQVLHLRALGSLPVGLADLPLSNATDAGETPQ